MFGLITLIKKLNWSFGPMTPPNTHTPKKQLQNGQMEGRMCGRSFFPLNFIFKLHRVGQLKSAGWTQTVLLMVC